MYAQSLGTIFTETAKPYEVELVVAEVGEDAETDQVYRLTFDGSVADEHGYVAMGGQADAVAQSLKDGYREGAPLVEALRTAVRALEAQDSDRRLEATSLEVAVLDRNREHRLFKRLAARRIADLLSAAEESGGSDITSGGAESDAEADEDRGASPGPGRARRRRGGGRLPRRARRGGGGGRGKRWGRETARWGRAA